VKWAVVTQPFRVTVARITPLRRLPVNRKPLGRHFPKRCRSASERSDHQWRRRGDRLLGVAVGAVGSARSGTVALRADLSKTVEELLTTYIAVEQSKRAVEQRAIDAVIAATNEYVTEGLPGEDYSPL
jgi:hypothetical protein